MPHKIYLYIRRFIRKKSRGFTLVELLVVVAIIGVLSTLILLNLKVARQKARDVKRVADIQEINNALYLHYDSLGPPPTCASYGGCDYVDPAFNMGCDSTADNIFLPFLTYLVAKPKDPLNGAPYLYCYEANINFPPLGAGVQKRYIFIVASLLEAAGLGTINIPGYGDVFFAGLTQ